VTDVSAEALHELTAAGIARHEARWLVDEFLPGGDPDAKVLLQAAADRRLRGEPLQYILGHWPFRTLDLEVDERVLIPRPETEELVGFALSELARARVTAPLIMDLGCGSGAIGLALLSELADRGVVATLVAVDESLDALAVARSNALKHRLRAVSFVHSSWYDNVDVSLRGRVDLLVANPPYVGRNALAQLDPVLAHEPLGALVSSDHEGVEGFADLAQVIGGAREWLAPTGVLLCEHGDTQREAVLRAATRAGFVHADDYDDMAGKPRVLIARQS
jgi:release factor glutamine methyltransferase